MLASLHPVLGSAEVGPGDRLAFGRLRRWSRQGDRHEQRCGEAGLPRARVKVREIPASVEGEPSREAACAQGPGRPQAASPFSPCTSLCTLC